MPSLSQLVGRLRFRHLALLVAIGEHRNLHRAAQAVHLAQPSATKLVHDLEQLFGMPLFERLPRGMYPTELGTEVLAFAKRTLGNLRRFAEDLEGKRRGGYGQLIIGAIMGGAPDVVARAMADIKTQRPLLTIRLVGETSEEIITLLKEGKIDLAVGHFGRFTNHWRHTDIHYEVLGNESLYMIARTGHPFLRVRNLSLPMLERIPWILSPVTNPNREIIEQEFGQEGIKTPTNIIECTSIFATLQLLQKTDAVSILPESVVRDHLLAGSLARLPLTIRKNLPGFGILSREGEPPSAAALEFMKSLRQYSTLIGADRRDEETTSASRARARTVKETAHKEPGDRGTA